MPNYQTRTFTCAYTYAGKDYCNEKTHVTAPVKEPHKDHMDR